MHRLVMLIREHRGGRKSHNFMIYYKANQKMWVRL